MPSTNPAPKSGGTFSAIRTIGPAIPLAIPLAAAMLHGALSGTLPAAPVTLQTTQQTAQSFVPVLAANQLTGIHCGGGTADSPVCPAPYPMLAKGHPVDWFFVFKLNASKFPQCGGGVRSCPFGGGSPNASYTSFGQQYVFASSEAGTLQDGAKECLGTTTDDPVGATFDEVYNGGFHYAVWNDQFKGSPTLACGADCDKPWGHSKGMLAWNDAGEGLVMQVSTPSWPGAGSAKVPRAGDGNTLGCVKDNDVEVSQHFFALRLTKDDLLQVLAGLENASVVTSPKNGQLVGNGGPADVQQAVNSLGVLSPSVDLATEVLSTGVRLISKPSHLNLPPWQMVSALLGGVPLRTATWWMTPEIPSTTANTTIDCWKNTSLGKPGAVDIATTGAWKGVVYSLKGGGGNNGNHAKLGVSTLETEPYAIFGDMNQQGALSGTCDSSQNGRGGLFFVMNNPELRTSIAGLIAGESAAAQ